MKNAPTYLRNLKSKVDKLDVDELVPGPVDLNKLSDVVIIYIYIMLRSKYWRQNTQYY